MKYFIRLAPLSLLLTLMAAACGGSGTVYFNGSNGARTAALADTKPISANQDLAPRQISASARTHLRAEMLNDSPAYPDYSRLDGASGNGALAAATPKIVKSQAILPVTEPEGSLYDTTTPLVGSATVVPGPSGEELSARLQEAFDQLGIDPAKVVSTPPTGTENTVLDLAAALDDPDGAGPQPPTGIILSWTEVMVGDYDQNGEVGISDLTPLGNKFLGTVGYNGDLPSGDPDDDGGSNPPAAGSGADNWRLARIDGDNNTEINLADITPIAFHFKQRSDGYTIYRKGPGEAGFTALANPSDPGSPVTAPRSLAYIPGENRMDPNRPVRFFFTDEVSADGTYEYYVAPYDDSTTSEGPESNHASRSFSTNVPPTASFTATPSEGDPPLLVNFDGSASADADGTITSFQWDFTNDGTFEENNGTTATTAHTYDTPGTFTAVLKVIDDKGAFNTASAQITVFANSLPTADIAATPTSGDWPLLVNFDASLSTDSDGTIVKFEWDWEGDASYDLDTGTTPTTSHTYGAAGLYQATVRVTDNEGGTGTDKITINVNNPTVDTLFDDALAGVGKVRADLNLGAFPDQVGFSGFLNRGNDETGFDLNADGDFGDPNEIVPGSRFGSFTNYWHNDHTALPSWARGHTSDVSSAANLEQIVKEANDVFFEGEVRQTFFAPATAGRDYVPDGTIPLAQAVIDLITNQGGTPDSGAIIADSGDVPMALQTALARVLLAADAAATARDDFLESDIYWGPVFGPYDPGTPPDTNIWHVAYNWSHAFPNRVPSDMWSVWTLWLFGLTSDDFVIFNPIGECFGATYAYDELAQAALDLSRALDQAEPTLVGGGIGGSYSFNQDTPIGRIVINSGGGTTTYVDDEYVLICDVDGDDTYNCPAGANASVLNPVSINIDVAGNDTYASLDDYNDAGGLQDDYRSQQGCGRMGVGMLVDYAGNDQYNASQMSQGAAVLGWGLLYDESGDDTYNGVCHVQGAGLFGVGILFDRNGTDIYNSWNHAQGYGDIWGLGILTDKGVNDDTFNAEWDSTVGPPGFASMVNPAVNMSFAQGAAFGMRTTGSFPVIWDGGVGIFNAEGGGNNVSCGVYGQGFGFWFGTGALSLSSGDNLVEGAAYAQGVGALYGAGICRTGSGPDSYNPRPGAEGPPLEKVMTGAAHDHSVGWLLDDGGIDTYMVPRIGLGTGNINGWAYFIDMGNGADTYGLTDGAFDAVTLGRGHLSPDVPDADPREGEITLGLFLDCGGTDVYDGAWASLENGDQGLQSAHNDTGWYRFGYSNDFAGDWRSNEFGTGYDNTGVAGFE